MKFADLTSLNLFASVQTIIEKDFDAEQPLKVKVRCSSSNRILSLILRCVI